MRFLGVSETCDLGALYLALQAEGHAVKVAVSEPLAEGTLAGLVPRTGDWRSELDWIRSAPDLGVILFESVSDGFGRLQDELRRDGFKVIGGSAYGDRLENDRAFAHEVLREIGLSTPAAWSFAAAKDALDFVRRRPRAYVVKHSGAGHEAGDTFVGRFPDGADVIAVLQARVGQSARDLILTEVVDGVETGVGAYFDGERFLTPACLDWEHKRFFPGDLGELTGEMGTVATFERTESFFRRTLGRMEPRLRENGYVGYINLNTIVNERGIWPLEFTCRFGYPGFAVLTPLQETPWAELLRAMATGSAGTFAARTGFSVGVVLTTPPFPYSRKQALEPVGLPVMFRGADGARHRHYGEVGLDGSGRLVTSGLYGWTLVVTGVGPTIAEAKRRAYEHVSEVSIPNARYRLDIGDRLIDGSYRRLERLGMFDPIPEPALECQSYPEAS